MRERGNENDQGEKSGSANSQGWPKGGKYQEKWKQKNEKPLGHFRGRRYGISERESKKIGRNRKKAREVNKIFKSVTEAGDPKSI